MSKSKNDEDQLFVDEVVLNPLEEVSLSYAFGEARPRAGVRLSQPPSVGVMALASISDIEAEIRNLISKYENLLPEQVIESLGDLTTSPYISIGDGIVDEIDAEALQAWIEGETYATIKDEFEGDAPHSVEITDISIHTIDESTASVSYQLTDTLPSGRTLQGASAAIVVKKNGKWQIAVHCQHPV